MAVHDVCGLTCIKILGRKTRRSELLDIATSTRQCSSSSRGPCLVRRDRSSMAIVRLELADNYAHGARGTFICFRSFSTMLALHRLRIAVCKIIYLQ